MFVCYTNELDMMQYLADQLIAIMYLRRQEVSLINSLHL